MDVLERDKFIVEQERQIQALNIKIRGLVKQNEVLKAKLDLRKETEVQNGEADL